MKTVSMQMLLLWRTRRVLALCTGLLVVFGILVWISALVASSFRNAPAAYALDSSVLVELARVILNIMSGAGAVWAIIVWRAESPSHRNYHWSLPVPTMRHDRARVAAGAFWLAVVCIVICIAIFLAQHVLFAGASVALPAPFWVSVFTVTLIPYLLASAIAIVSNHVGEWLLVLVLSCTALCVAGIEHPASVLWIADRLFLGPIGPGRALSGGWSDGTNNATHEIWTQFDLGNRNLWLLATTVWLLAGGITLFAASRRALESAA